MCGMAGVIRAGWSRAGWSRRNDTIVVRADKKREIGRLDKHKCGKIGYEYNNR